MSDTDLEKTDQNSNEELVGDLGDELEKKLDGELSSELSGKLSLEPNQDQDQDQDEATEFSEESLLEAHQKSEELNAEGVAEPAEIENLSFELAEENFVDGSELEQYESAEVEEQEFVEHERVISIVESLLFSTDRPQSVVALLQAFKGTQVRSKDVRKALEALMVEYAGGTRGVTIEEVSGGYQLRTKVDNMEFLKRMVKGRTFKLSGPALEVLAITAYKQPCVKYQVDEIRGVESGHLLRGLMERGLVRFAGKSDLPGKPMLYETTKKFLEIFGLRNIKELPSLNEIDDLIPEGIGEIEEEKTTLDQITGSMAQEAGVTYSEGEEELEKITGQLLEISTSSDFFEEEKRHAKAKKDEERAQSIREALIMEEEVSAKDKNWLDKYELELKLAAEQAIEAQQVTEGLVEGLVEDPAEGLSESLAENLSQAEGEGPVAEVLAEGILDESVDESADEFVKKDISGSKFSESQTMGINENNQSKSFKGLEVSDEFELPETIESAFPSDLDVFNEGESVALQNQLTKDVEK